MAELAPEDRPREKLERSGVGALGDNELLALVLSRGTAGEGALAVATRVLAEAGGVHGLARLTRTRLVQMEGLGPALASRVQAAVELGRRTLTHAPQERLQFRSPDDVAGYLLPRYGAHPVERFGVVLMDAKLRLIKTQLISTGTLDASSAEPREVFREAMAAGAMTVVVFHNHPSGDPAPSKDDVRLTQRLARAGEILGIQLVDHVILGDASYASLLDRVYF